MSYCPNYLRKEIQGEAHNPQHPFDNPEPIVFHECRCKKQTTVTGGSQCTFINQEHECPQNPDCME